MPAAAQLAFAELQVLGQADALGDFVKRLLLDQIGAQPRQVALVEALG